MDIKVMRTDRHAASTRVLGINTISPITMFAIFAELFTQSGSGSIVAGLPEPEAHKNWPTAINIKEMIGNLFLMFSTIKASQFSDPIRDVRKGCPSNQANHYGRERHGARDVLLRLRHSGIIGFLM